MTKPGWKAVGPTSVRIVDWERARTLVGVSESASLQQFVLAVLKLKGDTGSPVATSPEAGGIGVQRETPLPQEPEVSSPGPPALVAEEREPKAASTAKPPSQSLLVVEKRIELEKEKQRTRSTRPPRQLTVGGLYTNDNWDIALPRAEPVYNPVDKPTPGYYLLEGGFPPYYHLLEGGGSGCGQWHWPDEGCDRTKWPSRTGNTLTEALTKIDRFVKEG